MSLHHVTTPYMTGRYLLSSDEELPARLDLVQDEHTQHFTQIGSSVFLRTKDNHLLVKCVLDKYALSKKTFAKWLGRDFLSKRLLRAYDARKEYQSGQILKKCGQRVIQCHGYGTPLNPLNRYSSLYIMRYEHEMLSGKQYFAGLDKQQQWKFLERFVQSAITVAKQGYFHRDFHYGNVLIDHDEFVWIDSHVKALSKKAQVRAGQLFGMISPTKLGGIAFAERAHVLLADQFPEVEEFFRHRIIR